MARFYCFFFANILLFHIFITFVFIYLHFFSLGWVVCCICFHNRIFKIWILFLLFLKTVNKKILSVDFVPYNTPLPYSNYYYHYFYFNKQINKQTICINHKNNLNYVNSKKISLLRRHESTIFHLRKCYCFYNQKKKKTH